MPLGFATFSELPLATLPEPSVETAIVTPLIVTYTVPSVSAVAVGIFTNGVRATLIGRIPGEVVLDS